VDNPLSAGTVRLPRTHTEGDIPKTAISTGDVDTLECLMRKLGIADSEFSSYTGGTSATSRIHLYRHNGESITGQTNSQDNQPTLVGTTAGGGNWSQYDQVLFPCEGGETNENANALTNFTSYVNNGGRVFATHYSYTWLYQNAPFGNTLANWNTTLSNPADPLTGTIDDTFTKGADFASWLGIVGALSNVTPPQIAIHDPRRDLTTLVAGGGGQRWIYSTTPNSTQQFTVNTPVNAPVDQLCGRVVFSDFHVTQSGVALLQPFPTACTSGPMTDQEKALAFMLFDLSSCVQSDGQPPTPIQ
jgi:hypothetical protein